MALHHPIYLRAALHIIILVLITTKVIDWNAENAAYSRSCRQSFQQLFVGDSLPLYASPTSDHTQFYTYSEAVKALERVLYVYNHIEDLSTAHFLYGQGEQSSTACSESPYPIVATTQYWSSQQRIESYDKELYNASSLSFIVHDTASYFESLHSLTLSFYLCQVENFAARENKYNNWRVDIQYLFESQMFLGVSVDARLVFSERSVGHQDQLTDETTNFITYIEILLVIFNLVYILYILQDIRTAYLIYCQVKEAHGIARQTYLNRQSQLQTATGTNDANFVAAYYDWAEIPTGIKRSFHCYWSLFTLLAAVLSTADAIYCLSENDNRQLSYSSIEKSMLGLSVLMIWVAVLQFFYFHPSLYAIAMTIQTAIPRILAFSASFFPVYFSFIFLGMALFGAELGMFASFTMASKSMFSYMNGDNVETILILMTKQSYWASVLYGVIFMLIGAYLMLNIFIAIVEEAYFLSRKKGRQLEVLMWKNLQQLAPNSAQDPSPTLQDLHPRIDLGDDEEEEEEWIQSLFSTSAFKMHPPLFSAEDLTITATEEAAEMYILGRSHWDYSKMMDFLIEHLSLDK